MGEQKRSQLSVTDKVIRVCIGILFVLLVVAIWEIIRIIQPITPKMFRAEKDSQTLYISPTVLESENQQFYYSLLSEREQGIYRQLLQGALEMRPKIEVSSDDQYEVARILTCLRNDHPEIFWMSGTSEFLHEGNAYYYRPHYSKTKEERTEGEKRLQEIVSRFQAGLVPSWSEYERLRYTFDFTAKTLQYDLDTANEQTLYGAVTDGNTVCVGYSKLYQILLTKAGFENLVVVGTVRGSMMSGTHMWNLIKIDGKFYHSDATFGDGLMIYPMHEFVCFKEIGTREIIYPVSPTESFPKAERL